MLNQNKRNAIFVIEENDKLIWVAQKRPKFKDRDSFRPFWDDFDSADEAIDKILFKKRITYYRINKNKIETYRSSRYVNDPVSFTTRKQAEEKLLLLMESFDFTITRGTISVFFKGQTYNITASDARYPRFHKACNNNDVGEVIKLIHIGSKLKESLKTKEDGSFSISGHDIPAELSDKMIMAVKRLGDAKSITNFKKRLDKNQSKTAQKHLLEFLAHHGGCLLEDGRFLAYKYVNGDFKDCYTGKYDYSPGKTVTMPRDKVIEDPKEACAAGLHVGTWGYSGNHMTVLLCVVDPVDVVSVPFDYKHQKIRCCKVTSVRKIDSPVIDTVLPVSFLKSA